MKPFLRWVGGKGHLLPKIMPLVPKHITTYHEPFLGGGALFFALASETPRRFHHAVLSDANDELVNCYRQVRDNVEAVIKWLIEEDGHGINWREFERVKGLLSHFAGPDVKSSRAGRFIYLNRVGFNGLYRVNARGEYNVPFGRRADGKSIVVCPPDYAENLRACSRALQGATVRRDEEFDADAIASPASFVFLDPAYLPLSGSSFSAYTAAGFGVRAHARLADEAWKMVADGTPFILCNANTPVARDIYRGLKTIKVSARRSVSGKVKGRKPARELLVVAP